MNWIEKPYAERKQDVERALDRLEQESPDRFWLSSDQDGENTQEMNIILTAGDTSLYVISLMTVQLKAVREAAYALGQIPGDQVALTDALLNKAAVSTQERFHVDLESDYGVRLDIVVDTPGLTHDFVDKLLGDFIDNGEKPLQTQIVEGKTIRARLIRARNEKIHSYYTLR